ncbi:MAG: peptide ABC transporter substrate-binding protein [Xanthomonadales bacterium]|nr:peptide ABC transporter substrate-binding protein [Xanthomonadales bacterium]
MKPKSTSGVLLCCLLAGCGGEQDPDAPVVSQRPKPVELVMVDGRPDPAVLAAEQVLHRANGEEPQTLDPHLAEGVPSSHILRDLFEGLTTEAPDGTVVPGAAQRWNISRDGRIYTFYLRRDGRWSNGDPVTATDFVFAFRRSAAPATASNYAQVLLPIENAADVLAGAVPPSELGVSALDEYTLQIRLVDPTPYFLGLLSHSSTYPVHRASLEAHGNRFSRPGNLVSNGAFVLQNWVVRSHIELVRNPNYWNADAVILERVMYYPYEDQSTSLKQFRAGDLHWTYEVPNNQFKWLQKYYADELVISPWLGSYFFGFNLTREPYIESPELRRALVLAVDRELLTEKVTQFGEQPSYTLVPPGIGDYESPEQDWAGWTQAERNEEARRLYAQAGYSEDRPLRTEIRYNTSENHKKLALAIASIWKQVLGVQTTLVNEEWKVFLQNREQKVLTQVFRAGWISDYADPYSFLELFRTGHGQNDYGYSNEIYDRLLAEIASERIPARRQRLMQEAERMLLEAMPIIPVYTYVTKRLVDRHVRGWEHNVMDHHYSRSMFLLKSRPRRPEVPATGEDS